MTTSKLTHLNEHGEAHMVDVGAKAQTTRSARAEAYVVMQRATLKLITENNAPKGDVLATARIAGIMAAKRTHELIPLCHPLQISKISVDLTPLDEIKLADFAPLLAHKENEQNKFSALHIQSLVKLTGQTGVEMEALTAASVTCLTIYDMLKAVDREMFFTSIRLLEKSGGKSRDISFPPYAAHSQGS